MPEGRAARLQGLPGWRWGVEKASSSRRPATIAADRLQHKRGAEGAAGSTAERRHSPPGKKARRSAEASGVREGALTAEVREGAHVAQPADGEVLENLVVTTGVAVVDGSGTVR